MTRESLTEIARACDESRRASLERRYAAAAGRRRRDLIVGAFTALVCLALLLLIPAAIALTIIALENHVL